MLRSRSAAAASPARKHGPSQAQREETARRRRRMAAAASPHVALQLACETGADERAAELLEAGADANFADDKGRRAIHFAACAGHAAIVTALVAHGADVNVHDVNGNSPLHLAVISNHLDVVTVLLRAGADVNSTDIHARTPVDAARSRIRMLQRRGLASDDEVPQILDMLLAYARARAPRASDSAATVRRLEQLQDELVSVSFAGSRLDALQDALDRLSF